MYYQQILNEFQCNYETIRLFQNWQRVVIDNLAKFPDSWMDVARIDKIAAIKLYKMQNPTVPLLEVSNFIDQFLGN